MTKSTVEIALLDEDEVKAVSKVLAAIMDDETDYDHLKPLIDAWSCLHEEYSRVYFFTDKPTTKEVEKAVDVIRKVDNLERKETVLEFIAYSSDPDVPEDHRPLPDYDGDIL